MENITDFMPLSPDWNKERLETLKKLYPDLFTQEGRLDILELKKLVDPDLVAETERYEFRWFGKSQAKRNAFTPTNTTLKYDEHRSLNPSESENIIIEGDNLEVLKLLSGAYREKIKCIYIDPPYNTGKDFVYSDNFNQDKKAYWEEVGITEGGVKIDTNAKADGRYHSNWLNMMYPRLLLARQLLKDDGVIFISIDDNEITHLRKLCDEVFGTENFVAQLTILCNPKGRSQDMYFASNHEYVLVYSKSVLPKGAFSIEKDESQIEIEYPEEDENGEKYRLLELRNTHREFGKHNRKNLYYPLFINPDDHTVSLLANGNTIEVFPNWEDGYEGCWTWDKAKATKDIEFLEAKLVGNSNWKVYRKSYANGAEKMCKTILVDKSFFTEKGQSAFNSLFDTKSKLFQSPKSVELLKNLLRTTISDGDIVLDFFGGSGSTGHAVCDLMLEDNLPYKFIVVQLPELTDEKSEAYRVGFKKISDITIERNKRVINKIIAEKKQQQPDLFSTGGADLSLKGLGFKVFKLTKSNFPRVEFAPDPEKTDEENLELLKKYIRDKEAQLVSLINRDELMTEILLKNNFNLNFTLAKVDAFTKNEIFLASDGEKESLICLDIVIDMDTVDIFKKDTTNRKFICLGRALDTTKKWNLAHYLKERFRAF